VVEAALVGDGVQAATWAAISRSNSLFVAMPDPSAAPTPEGDLQVQDGSPAINAGSNALIADAPPPGNTTNLAGNPRISNDIIDLGTRLCRHCPTRPDGDAA
jgi:hypothetical protein